MTRRLRFGAQLTDTGVTFRLWAPAARRVELLLGTPHPMHARPGGWHEIAVPDASAGTLYKFRIDGELAVPDPASHFPVIPRRRGSERGDRSRGFRLAGH